MAFLKIVRDAGYADRLRAYKVVIDGKTAGEIRNGETKEFAVSAGQHNVLLKIDWCGSKTVAFAVAEADVITFSAKSNLRGLRLLAAIWYALFGWNSWIILREQR